MKRVARYQTSDGKLHEDAAKAKKHAEARYADVLLKLAHKLVQLDKYKATAEFLDAHTDELATLKDLKADALIDSIENEDQD